MVKMENLTGLPQGSPISPVLFALYVAEIHGAVKDQVEDNGGISFVDYVTWIVEGTDISDVASKLGRCAAARWADENTVRFEASKTEAILSSKGQKHKRCRREIQVGPHRVRFNPGATRWLGIWSDASLKLAENRKRRIGKTTPGRGQAPAGGQPVWSPTSGGQKPPGGDRPRNHALRIGTHLERQGERRKRVPAGHQPYGPSIAGRLSDHATGQSERLIHVWQRSQFNIPCHTMDKGFVCLRSATPLAWHRKKERRAATVTSS